MVEHEPYGSAADIPSIADMLQKIEGGKLLAGWEYDSTGLPSPAGGVWMWSRLLIDDYGSYVRLGQTVRSSRSRVLRSRATGAWAVAESAGSPSRRRRSLRSTRRPGSESGSMRAARQPASNSTQWRSSRAAGAPDARCLSCGASDWRDPRTQPGWRSLSSGTNAKGVGRESPDPRARARRM